MKYKVPINEIANFSLVRIVNGISSARRPSLLTVMSTVDALTRIVGIVNNIPYRSIRVQFNVWNVYVHVSNNVTSSAVQASQVS